MPQRIDLDAMVKSEPRRPIDASWSPRTKKLVGAAAGGVALAALAGGAWAYISGRPPALPTTPEQALAVMASSKFDSLDKARRSQYIAEAQRLMRGMTPEQRRALMQDEKNRDAMREMREEMMDEMARRIARGEQVESPFAGMGFGGPRGERRPDGERPQRDPNAQPTAEQQARMEERRQQMESRFAQAISTGNAQSFGLRAEMMRSMMRTREQNGGQRGGQGGGQGGGGNRPGGG
jgi:hypothetical protein